jgi:hypothetical protein
MIKNINDLNKLPMCVLLYTTGTSGEFIAHALTESVTGITKTRQHWENVTRCKYFDLFDRTLTSDIDQPIDTNKVVSGVNLYLDENDPNDTVHLGLIHPKKFTLEFIQQYIPDVPIIEIVTEKMPSKLFRFLSQNKVGIEISNSPYFKHNNCGYHGPYHLRVEWDDLLIDNVDQSFKKIINFIQLDGSVNKFKLLVADYLERNSNTIDKIRNLDRIANLKY